MYEVLSREAAQARGIEMSDLCCYALVYCGEGEMQVLILSSAQLPEHQQRHFERYSAWATQLNTAPNTMEGAAQKEACLIEIEETWRMAQTLAQQVVAVQAE